MSNLNSQQNFSCPRRPGTNKRQWTHEEEAKLVEVLTEFHSEGKLKTDKGFKPGQLIAIEERLNMKLPGCEIKAKPHIDSKLRTFKKHFGIVHDMIAGPNCSGFHWDSTRKCITAGNDVWDKYLKSHPEANQFRYTCFAHYDELCKVWRKNIAILSNIENCVDVVEEYEKENDEQDDNGVDFSVSCDDSPFFSCPRRPGTNKRQWTHEEEVKLVEILIEFNSEGKFKTDKGFKPGQLIAIEERLDMKLPGCGIKAKPHIDSKLRTFKKHFGIVHEMIAGPNCSGFHWDSTRKCITAGNGVWDEYLKSHPEANQFRYKCFAHYDELCKVWRKNLAILSNAENSGDGVEEYEKENDEQDDNGVDVSVSCDDSPFFCQYAKKQKTNVGISVSHDDSSSCFEKYEDLFVKLATMLGAEIRRSTDKICQTLEKIGASGNKSRLYDALKALHGLSMTQRHKAIIKIGCDRKLIDVFFTIPDEEKEVFVLTLLE